jgi:DNA-binding response OmpR family regulator
VSPRLDPATLRRAPADRIVPRRSLTGPVTLVIDDDPAIRQVLRTMLELEGYQVYEAMNGSLGLGLIGAIDPPVVVLDVMMPGISGVDICRQIDHQRHAVIILTARDDRELAEECAAAGRDRFMTKPVDVDELTAAVAELAVSRAAFR